ncbi:inositol -triphosphate receptor 2, putative [Ichthyophthirius multifiliis]|uniref:Inositol-triphosphate receptor 2, putative n=1 Tax=Ichthyophthirius multifiliis TaxID=5932 RepID=G0QNT3_ICHMU|nr:inositol -triphosphate receptor 2, putative [Ichthyophthirius multifiliis]EGR33124.1 inositol -triphosphate receptor 2, putative [Ichthyophthirius multifiliis]|eukprot:XP_004037110.1 inositol -triphosphate receptor 2, putative [Ichthyophthirius multifiliis]
MQINVLSKCLKFLLQLCSNKENDKIVNIIDTIDCDDSENEESYNELCKLNKKKNLKGQQQNKQIFESDRSSDIDRITFLIENIEFYKSQMIYRQKLAQQQLLIFFINNIQTIKNLLYAVVIIINGLQSLRNGGGISEALGIAQFNDPYSDEDYYWARYTFDLTNYIIIQTLFIQIFFGIILDTFGELRTEKDQILQDINSKCYICGIDKNIIQGQSQSNIAWEYHMYLEHNLYHLMMFIIQTKQKNFTECNQIEKYVIKQLRQQKIDFVPIRTLPSDQKKNIKEESD